MEKSALHLRVVATVIALLAGCSGGGGGGSPSAPPDLSGVWAGTWSGVDPVAGSVTGTWEADLTQSGTGVSGPVVLAGDIDCSDAQLTGSSTGDNAPTGALLRPPCQQNAWTLTALDLSARKTAGSWSQSGSNAQGTFTGTQIARPGGPRISFVTPPSGRPGTVVTVVGTGFATNASDNTLTFNGTAAQLIRPATATTLVTVVPAGAGSGPLVVTTPQDTAIAPSAFNAAPVQPAPVLADGLVVGPQPEGVVFGPDGRHAYVAQRGDGTVAMIDPGTRRLLLTSASVVTAPGTVRGIAVSPDGRRLYTSYYEAGGGFGYAVLHATTLAILQKTGISAGVPLPQDAAPHAVATTPDGRLLLVACSVPGGAVSGIDLATGRETLRVTLGGGATPSGVAVSPDGQSGYAAFAGADEVVPFTLVSGATGAPVAVGAGPSALAMAPDGAHLYVANRLAASVSVIDTSTRTVSATWNLAGAEPAALAVAPDGSRVYVASRTDGNVWVLWSDSGGNEARFYVAAAPAGLAVSPDGARGVVADQNANRLNLIGSTVTLTIAKGGTGIGRVSSTPAGIDCGSVCQASYPQGTSVTLTAIPDSGSTFAGWSGDPDCADGVVTLDGAKSCTANFSAIPHDSGGSVPGSGCFIATAAYGSPLHPHVAALRQFRDRYLLKTSLGQDFVALYYRCSPPVARVISRYAALRALTRWMLTPLVYGIEYGFGLDGAGRKGSSSPCATFVKSGGTTSRSSPAPSAR